MSDTGHGQGKLDASTEEGVGGAATQNVVGFSRTQLQVPVRLVIIIFVVFVVGVAGGLVLHNALSQEQPLLSTPALVSLVFTVAVGAASAILALIAILLSRLAEEALVRRSDEGIRLQSEVFVRTNEVLSRIEASTGVTEKRIEDIISGRTGPIVQEAILRARLSEEGLPREVEERIKEDLTETLKSELLPLLRSRPAEAERRLAELETRQERKLLIERDWSAFRSLVLGVLKEIPEVNVIRDQEGEVGADDETFWDGILEVDSKRIGLLIQTNEQVSDGYDSEFLAWRTNASARRRFVRQLIWREMEDNMDMVFVILDEDVWSEDGIREVGKDLGIFSENYKRYKVTRLAGGPEEIAKEVVSIVKEANEGGD